MASNRRFIISDYRAIEGPLEISVSRESLTPIIGVNESGKTTILHAIFAFDHFNDALNDNGRQLRDTGNLYETSSKPARISAEIECSKSELSDCLDSLRVDEKNAKSFLRRFKAETIILIIERELVTKKYWLPDVKAAKAVDQDALCQHILGKLPYILFFDDFRDSIEEIIPIAKGETGPAKGWLAILEQLFVQTDPKLSVFNLAAMEERNRKSAIAKVKRHLNLTLTKEWQSFRLDETDALEISIEFIPPTQTSEEDFGSLKLEIIETDANGDEHYFFIRDRSKGFFWFFNFVMKLDFNPKVVTGSDERTIYLLDEPGSYLHATAQSRLCSKLKDLSKINRVIYCTHSHYLLNPEFIPLSSIKVADKDGKGRVTLLPIHQYAGDITERRSAFQPVIDALEIKPFVLDMNFDKVIIVEGIVDYYCSEMFKNGRSVGVIPSTGADSIQYFISLMVAWGIRFFAIWDEDEQGRRARDRATELFGAELASSRFFTLAGDASGKKTILQDLFDGDDIKMIKETLNLPRNTAFASTMSALFYAEGRATILDLISIRTKDRFNALLTHVLGEGTVVR